MFGHDDKNQNEEEHVTADVGHVVQPMSTTPPDEKLMGVSPAPAAPAADDEDDDDISKIVEDINASDDTDEVPEATSTPTVEPEPAEEPNEADDKPAPEPEQPTQEEQEEATADAIAADEPTLSETELLEVKKSALQELSPLLDELDQTADEKLNILMMTIQATDDQSLLPQALETAKKIDDKKARAEAMLDIIQEITYFTKKK